MWNNIENRVWNWRGVVFIIPIIVGLTIGIRSTGWLQPLEWVALDIFFQLRTPEPTDRRILIVGVEESDIQQLGWPLSDRVLANLLTKIKQQQPRVIGLDIYRDVPVNPGHGELVKIWQNTPNLIGVEKIIGDEFSAKIAPPPLLKELGRVSSIDMVVDGDGVVRRGVLYPTTEGTEAIPSFGLAVALKYLQQLRITPKAAEQGFLQLGQTVFVPFEADDGGYVRSDAGGYQILLNYRDPARSFPRVSVSDVLENRIPPDLMRDRIVLIGPQAPSLNDTFYTPFSRGLASTPVQTTGVEIQANLASQILSSVLDNRPLIRTGNNWFELLWTSLWCALIVIAGWRFQQEDSATRFSLQFFLKLTVSTSLAAVSLVGISYLAFLYSWWTPVVPPLLTLFTGAIIVAGYTYISKLELYSQTLEARVKERTLELSSKNAQLEHTLQELEDTQERIIAQEKLASLGRLIMGIAHTLNNPLNFVINFVELSTEVANEINQDLSRIPNLAEEVVEQLQGNLDLLSDNLLEIQQQSERINQIIKTVLRTREENAVPEPTDINAIVAFSVRLVCHSLQNKYENFSINITSEYDSSITQLNVVSQELSQALINIIDNACYSAYKKRQLLGENFVPQVLVRTIDRGESVAIAIRDNGQGIPQSETSKIFDPFFTTKPPGEGTGLGLYLAYEIITKHQGRISVDTRPEDYTEFTITLPKAFQSD